MSLKTFLMKLIYAPGVNPLPLKIVMIIFTVLLFNAMTTTMVFSYLPELVTSFGYSEVDKGTYVGIVASSMFVGYTISSFFWGYIADVKGKKLTLIITCLGVSAGSLAFGFSTNIYMAIVTRFLQGAFGIQVVAQAMLFEVCDNTNKALAMTVCLSAYSLGLVLGPSLGGYLALPAKQYPNVFSKDSILAKYTILLPNIVLSFGFFVLALLLACVRHSPKKGYESLSDSSNKETIQGKKKSDLSLLFRNKLCWISCFIYTLFQMFALGFNELYPVWASTSREYNGLSMTTSEIGTSLMIAAGVLVFIQPIIIARSAVKFGVRMTFIYSLLAQAVLYSLYPSISSITNSYVMWITLCIVIIPTRIAVGASFTGASVIINDSVPANLIGAANGLGITVSGIGSSIAPTVFGRIFSWSLTNIETVPQNENPYGYPLNQYFSFFIMTILSILTAYLVTTLPPIDNSNNNFTLKYEERNTTDEYFNSSV